MTSDMDIIREGERQRALLLHHMERAGGRHMSVTESLMLFAFPGDPAGRDPLKTFLLIFGEHKAPQTPQEQLDQWTRENGLHYQRVGMDLTVFTWEPVKPEDHQRNLSRMESREEARQYIKRMVDRHGELWVNRYTLGSPFPPMLTPLDLETVDWEETVSQPLEVYSLQDLETFCKTHRLVYRQVPGGVLFERGDRHGTGAQT